MSKKLPTEEGEYYIQSAHEEKRDCYYLTQVLKNRHGTWEVWIQDGNGYPLTTLKKAKGHYYFSTEKVAKPIFVYEN